MDKNSGEDEEVQFCDATSRDAYVKALCDKAVTTPFDFRKTQSLFVDERHKVIYCFLPKVACTSFKALMIGSVSNMTIQSIIDNRNKFALVHTPAYLKLRGVRNLMMYSKQEAEYRLHNYFKFMAVRHPFDRLLSAWRDKREYIKNKRTLISQPTPAQVFSFKQFLKQEVAMRGEAHFSDHWVEYWKDCHPCHVRYDSIVRLETMERDIQLILSKLPGPTGNPNVLPRTNVKSPSSPLKKLQDLANFYETIDEALMSKLLHRYKLDFKLFGYHWNPELKVGTCKFEGIAFGNKTLQPCC